jgi:L-threonylcarbamoyladenylate synthase
VAAGDELAPAIAALRAGGLVLLPTDGVYGLCAPALDAEAVRRLYALKGRAAHQPAAILAASVEVLLAALPETGAREAALIRGLLPGRYTLVLANPCRRFAAVTGARPETIGVRVAALPASSQAVLDAVSVVAATSANLAGGRDPARLEDVPAQLRRGCAAELDGGRLPGTPSTVVDLSGPEPRVLREGAVPAVEALARIAALEHGDGRAGSV